VIFAASAVFWSDCFQDGNALNDCLKNMYKKTPTKTDPSSSHKHQSQSSKNLDEHINDTGPKMHSLFVIDRKGNHSHLVSGSPVHATSSTVVERTKNKDAITKEPRPNSGSSVSGSRGGTPSRMLPSDTKTCRTPDDDDDDDDPELIILDITSTVSDDPDSTEAKLDQLMDNNCDISAELGAKPKHKNGLETERGIQSRCDVTEPHHEEFDICQLPGDGGKAKPNKVIITVCPAANAVLLHYYYYRCTTCCTTKVLAHVFSLLQTW